MDAQNFPIDELNIAIGKGNIDLIKQFISPLDKAKLNNLKDGKGFTPLFYAISIQNFDIVKLFIDRGIDVNVQAFDRTPLMQAVKIGNKDIIKLLLDAKADLKFVSADGGTALSIAIKDGNVDIVDFLNTYQPQSSEGYFRSAYNYFWPAKKQSPNPSPVLNEKNNNIQEEKRCLDDSYTLTPGQKLREAAGRGDLVGVTNLIPQLKKNILNETNANGHTALIIAAEGGYLDVVKLLIAAEVDLNIQTVDGNSNTALMCAVIKNHVAIVEALLKAKARVDKKDFANNTVFTLAENNPEIMALLKLYAHQEAQSMFTSVANYAYSWLPAMPTLTFLAPLNNRPVEALDVQNIAQKIMFNKNKTPLKPL
jgi:ankyrin repeat protein